METKIMIGKSYYITANAQAFSGYPDGLEFKVLGILTDGRDYPIVMGCDELGEEFFQSFSEEELIPILNNEKLSQQNKINILESLLHQIRIDHPEFDEENTTGWDLIENAKIWLDELNNENLSL